MHAVSVLLCHYVLTHSMMVMQPILKGLPQLPLPCLEGCSLIEICSYEAFPGEIQSTSSFDIEFSCTYWLHLSSVAVISFTSEILLIHLARLQ